MKRYEDHTDAELQRRYRERGDGRAFSTLAKRYFDRGLAELAASRLPDNQFLDDVIMYAFRKFSDHLRDHNRPYVTDPLAFLSRSVINRSIDVYRKHYRRRTETLLDEIFEVEDQPAEDTLTRESTHRSRWNILKREIGRLNAKQQHAIVNVHLNGQSIDALCEETGWTKKEAYNYLKGGKDRLVRRCRPEDPTLDH